MNPPLKRKTEPVTLAIYCIVAVLALFLIFSDGSSSSSSVSTRARSKAEWMSAARSSGVHIVAAGIWGRSELLYTSVGRPHESQNIMNDTYLYWNCSDGQIQLVTNRAALEMNGELSGNVNSY